MDASVKDATSFVEIMKEYTAHFTNFLNIGEASIFLLMIGVNW
jgi:hypothetical protein